MSQASVDIIDESEDGLFAVFEFLGGEIKSEDGLSDGSELNEWYVIRKS